MVTRCICAIMIFRLKAIDVGMSTVSRLKIMEREPLPVYVNGWTIVASTIIVSVREYSLFMPVAFRMPIRGLFGCLAD